MGVARARPLGRSHWSGRSAPGDPRTDVSVLERLPNVHLLGSRPYGALPEVLRGADAALVPYAINDLTRSVFPMKVYEYLAAGLPVVTHPTARAQRNRGGGGRGRRPGHRGSGRARACRRRTRGAAGALRAARGHSWDARLEEIDSYLSGLGRA